MAEVPQPPSEEETAASLLDLQADAIRTHEREAIRYANEALLPLAQQQSGADTPPAEAPAGEIPQLTVTDLERELQVALDHQKTIFQKAWSPDQEVALHRANDRVERLRKAMEAAREQ